MLRYATFQKAENKGADQCAQMRRLICFFVVRKYRSQGFSRRGPYAVHLSCTLSFLSSVMHLQFPLGLLMCKLKFMLDCNVYQPEEQFGQELSGYLSGKLFTFATRMDYSRPSNRKVNFSSSAPTW